MSTRWPKTHIKPVIERDPHISRSNDVGEICGDFRKLRDVTGWQPEIPLEQTIVDLLEYWRTKQSKLASLI